MSMLEMAISCLKAAPAFGLPIFLHQPSSNEILISVVGCLLDPKGSSAEYRLIWEASLLIWVLLLALSGNDNCMEHTSSSFLQVCSLSLVLKSCAAEPGLEQHERVPCSLMWGDTSGQLLQGWDVAPSSTSHHVIWPVTWPKKHSLCTQKWNSANFTSRSYFLCWVWQYNSGGKQSSSRHWQAAFTLLGDFLKFQQHCSMCSIDVGKATSKLGGRCYTGISPSTLRAMWVLFLFWEH